MIANKAELDHFHYFASRYLTNGGQELSLEELLARWRAAQERESVNEALREAIADLNAGRSRPADEVVADLRRKHSIRAE